jgi:hypothetical protein
MQLSRRYLMYTILSSWCREKCRKMCGLCEDARVRSSSNHPNQYTLPSCVTDAAEDFVSVNQHKRYSPRRIRHRGIIVMAAHGWCDLNYFGCPIRIGPQRIGRFLNGSAYFKMMTLILQSGFRSCLSANRLTHLNHMTKSVQDNGFFMQASSGVWNSVFLRQTGMQI